jgi:hypothetical protein
MCATSAFIGRVIGSGLTFGHVARASSTRPTAAAGSSWAATSAARSSIAGPNASRAASRRPATVETGRPSQGRNPAGRNLTPSTQPRPSSRRTKSPVETGSTSAVPASNTRLHAGWYRIRWS